jgi:hypothetical protein
MGDFDRSSKTRMRTVKTAHEVSDRHEDSNRNWTRGQSCYILPKHLSTFHPSPETLWEAEFKPPI